MLKENFVEATIGAGVLVAAAIFLWFLTQSSGVASNADSYALTAKFRSAEGVIVGSDVRLAGVKVGTVTALTLDPTTYLAEAEFSLAATVQVPDDSEAGIESEGLLGGAFINLEPGGSEFMLAEGDEILNTQSAVSLIDLLVRYATSGSSGE